MRYRDASMSRLREYADARELTLNLTLRELRTRYKKSVLGWTWSLMNPLATMLIFTLVFSFFLKVTPSPGNPSGLNSFALFLLCGLLPWNFLSGGMSTTTESLLGNQNLIKKVYFPREIIVFSTVLSLFVTFVIEMGVLTVALLIVGNMVLPWLPLLFGLMLIESGLVLGLGLMLSTLNVYFRDVRYLISISLTALFYSMPIVYPIRVVPVHAHILGVLVPFRRLYLLNPLVRMVQSYRAVLYDLRFPAFGDVAYLLAWTVGLCVLGFWVFRKFERRLAEEL
jgi:lipopolysaccharide transport system permease protein